MPDDAATKRPESEHRARHERPRGWPAGLVRDAVLRMEVPGTMDDPGTYQRLSLHQLIYSTSGLVLGLSCIVGGIVLFLHGVAGSTSWSAKIFGVESQLSDAAPGAVLFLVGLFVVLITRFTIKVQKP